jgi:hypothetical protein
MYITKVKSELQHYELEVYRIILILAFKQTIRKCRHVKHLMHGYQGSSDRSKKKTFENSHKNSTISYWNLQECEGNERRRKWIGKRPKMEDVVKTVKQKRASRNGD